MKELFHNFQKIIKLFEKKIKRFTHYANDFRNKGEKGTENFEKNRTKQRKINYRAYQCTDANIDTYFSSSGCHCEI